MFKTQIVNYLWINRESFLIRGHFALDLCWSGYWHCFQNQSVRKIRRELSSMVHLSYYILLSCSRNI
uniref:Uncharacterized protein n=1 Tax=Salix viminalis TaxID=40686 RepID=A0A6N2KHE7_SALVM